MTKATSTTATIEKHPWEPFAPAGAKILFLGSFPPPRIRWSMEFYYPNITNDFWKVIGIIFFDDKEHFIEKAAKRFKESEIKQFLTEKGIALYDAATAVRRLGNNASDAQLQIVEATDIASLLARMPHCHHIAVTGEKAAQAILSPHKAEIPKRIPAKIVSASSIKPSQFACCFKMYFSLLFNSCRRLFTTCYAM